MPISNLSRFTVPLASNQSSPTQGLLMPKLSYRFRVSLDNFGVTSPRSEITKQVISAARPNVSFDQITLETYNSRVYMAGKHSWQPVQIVVRDDVGGNVTKLIGEQLQKQTDFLEQASAASASDYKFTTRMEMLDGGNGNQGAAPRVLETWELNGCYLESVNYGETNYGTNDALTITLSIRYDNALQTPLGSGLGTAITRTIGTLSTQ